MSANADGPLHTRVYTTETGRAVIEQGKSSVVLTAEDILAVIKELHACYDYCASWKEPIQEED